MELTDENARLNNHGHRHTLMIPSVTEEDLGNYTCRAENKHGLTSRELEVSGKTCLFHLERNLPRMMVDLSKYLTLTRGRPCIDSQISVRLDIFNVL